VSPADSPRFRVYVSDYDYPDLDIERSVLEPIGAEVIGLQCKDGVGLADLAKDADAILQQYAKIPRATIEALDHCKAICRYGLGVDIVDVAAAYEHGMVVTNVPDYCLDEVADHSITLAFMLLRRIPWYIDSTRQGLWHWRNSQGPVLPHRGSTWGFIGFGRIPQNSARKLLPFGFRMVAYDPYVSRTFMGTFGVEKVELEELAARSDVVHVNAPYSPETHHIVDAALLRQMKSTTVLVNGSRGKCVDNAGLAEALETGVIAAAGLDDVEEEPAKRLDWSPEENRLFSLPNCFITPHVAYVSEVSLRECRAIAAENARAVLLGQRPPNLVRP
jgi:D-3-phosphoglycerate dehydrogenase